MSLMILRGFGSGTAAGGGGGSIAHGESYVISGSGFGTKTDNNGGGYDFQGKTHIVARATDFDNGSTSTPAANTLAGWQAHLDGVYPCTGATTFNSDSVADQATFELTGGPSQSGKYLERLVDSAAVTNDPTNYRLKNFCLVPSTGSATEFFFACYVRMYTSANNGKWIRFYFSGASNSNTSLWLGKPSTITTGRAEYPGGGSTTFFADNHTHTDGGWFLCEILVDFDNNSVRIYHDATELTDVSNGYTGDFDDYVGTGGSLDYFLLGNTLDQVGGGNGDGDESVSWACPYIDYSLKRVYITDHATWGSETERAVQVPTAWADTSITIAINQGNLANLTSKYVHVVSNTTALYSGALE